MGCGQSSSASGSHPLPPQQHAPTETAAVPVERGKGTATDGGSEARRQLSRAKSLKLPELVSCKLADPTLVLTPDEQLDVLHACIERQGLPAVAREPVQYSTSFVPFEFTDEASKCVSSKTIRAISARPQVTSYDVASNICHTLPRGAETAHEKHLLVIIGNTGAGKSTCVNYVDGRGLHSSTSQLNVSTCCGLQCRTTPLFSLS